MRQARYRNRRPVAMVLPAVLAGLLVTACGGSTGPEGPFTLAFSGDASFHVPDGGDELRVAVVLMAPDTVARDSVVARDSTTVSSLADPSFSFTFPKLLEAGSTYAVEYWINSNGNFQCDPPPQDHQWRESLGRVTGAVDRVVTFDGSTMVDVCATFRPDTTASP